MLKSDKVTKCSGGGGGGGGRIHMLEVANILRGRYQITLAKGWRKIGISTRQETGRWLGRGVGDGGELLIKAI